MNCRLRSWKEILSASSNPLRPPRPPRLQRFPAQMASLPGLAQRVSAKPLSGAQSIAARADRNRVGAELQHMGLCDVKVLIRNAGRGRAPKPAEFLSTIPRGTPSG